jgi:hypothetical protein
VALVSKTLEEWLDQSRSAAKHTASLIVTPP